LLAAGCESEAGERTPEYKRGAFCVFGGGGRQDPGERASPFKDVFQDASERWPVRDCYELLDLDGRTKLLGEDFLTQGHIPGLNTGTDVVK
jgi:hypothetical protein